MEKTALIGYCSDTGLGIENRRMWQNMDFESWLLIRHPNNDLAWGDRSNQPRADCICPCTAKDEETAHRWVQEFGPEKVVFVERPFPENFDGLSVYFEPICLVNPEWLIPSLPWVACISKWVTRNRFGYNYLTSGNFPTATDVAMIPCPFPLFSPPELTDHDPGPIYVNGWGGVHNRKGWPLIRSVLMTDPKLLEVCTQKKIDTPGVFPIPYEQAYENRRLAIQPSRFGSIELSIIEPLIRGIPCIAINAAPMNEPILSCLNREEASRFLLPVSHTEEVSIWGRPWKAYNASPVDLVDRIESFQHDERLSRKLIQRTKDHTEAWVWLERYIEGEYYPLSKDTIKLAHSRGPVWTTEDQLRELAYMADSVHYIEGDFVEYGVGFGTSALVLSERIYVGYKQRTLRLYDTFKGNPEPGQYDSGDIGGKCEASRHRVAEALDLVPSTQYIIHEGDLRTIGPPDEIIALMHIDCDLYEAAKYALENTVLADNAAVIINVFHPGPMRAWKEFYATHANFISAEREVDRRVYFRWTNYESN